MTEKEAIYANPNDCGCVYFEAAPSSGTQIGSDTSITTNDGARDCYFLCQGESQCAYWLFDHRNEICRLMKADTPDPSNWVFQQHRTGGTKDCNPVTGTCALVDGSYSSGTTVHWRYEESMLVCYQRCVLDSRCTHYTYRYYDNRCHLKTYFRGSLPKVSLSRHVAGPKTCFPRHAFQSKLSLSF